MIYSVSIPQMASLRASFATAPALVAEHAITAINTSLIVLQRDAKKNSPIDNGTLRSSIQITPARLISNRISGSVGTNLQYAQFQERGTGIYGPYQTPITPKNGQFLVFRTKDGQWIKTRSVKGVKPTWFMKNALAENRIFIQNQFQLAIDAVAKALARGVS